MISVHGDRFLHNGAGFIPVGFNYDHDEHYRLLEDYWHDEWSKVAADFARMSLLGANVIRIHLQIGRFLPRPGNFNTRELEKLDQLLALAVQYGIRIHLVGLGCYHKHDTPSWYDALDQETRWDTHALFWRVLAHRYKGHPAIFCFDLMNEPVVPGRKRPDGAWLGTEYAGKCFLQFITLDGDKKRRGEIATAWIKKVSSAVRQEDPDRLLTIGMVDWTLDESGMTSGFVAADIAPLLDFISAHIYPFPGKVEEAVHAISQYRTGKPLLLDETFPLRCPVNDIDHFLSLVRPAINGFLGFYTDYNVRPTEAWQVERDVLMAGWLEVFERQAKHYKKTSW